MPPSRPCSRGSRARRQAATFVGSIHGLRGLSRGTVGDLGLLVGVQAVAVGAPSLTLMKTQSVPGAEIVSEPATPRSSK
jgi:hypothetical protein